jgi:hypothetical protein
VAELTQGEVAEFGHIGPRQDRLRVLLFLIEKKLRQRDLLRFRVTIILAALMLISFALLITAGVTIHRVFFFAPEAAYYAALDWRWYAILPVAAVPFAITFMHYLWITFLQMYYRSFSDVERLLESTDYEEFRPYIHTEILAEDGSLLSVLRSLFAVDIGLSSAIFALGGIACALVPFLVQGIASIGAVILIWQDNIALAVGAGVFYALFLVLAATKTFSLFAFVRRLG